MLNMTVEMLKRRRTKIVATLGPASSDGPTIERLITAGMNVVRLNMSHGDHHTHTIAYKEVRSAAQRIGTPIGILADLCGPKLRVGRFEGGSTLLATGTAVTVTTRDVMGGPELFSSQYPNLHEEIEPGGRILLDDGQLELRVESIDGTEIRCVVVHGGVLKDR